jgi:hypothetical protein
VGFFQRAADFRLGSVGDFSAFRHGIGDARHHLVSNRDMVFNGFDLGAGDGEPLFFWRKNTTVWDENTWVELMQLADNGNLNVVGTLSKGGGSFKIDHPLDPLNKNLYHSFVESPDMKNIYDGVAVTDGDGFATVELPAWFEALNRDFRYQLTAVGQFAQAIVSQKVKGNRFTIQTDRPGVEVSYAEKHRIPVEEVKPAREKGRYLHPDAWRN